MAKENIQIEIGGDEGEEEIDERGEKGSMGDRKRGGEKGQEEVLIVVGEEDEAPDPDEEISIVVGQTEIEPEEEEEDRSGEDREEVVLAEERDLISIAEDEEKPEEVPKRAPKRKKKAKDKKAAATGAKEQAKEKGGVDGDERDDSGQGRGDGGRERDDSGRRRGEEEKEGRGEDEEDEEDKSEKPPVKGHGRKGGVIIALLLVATLVLAGWYTFLYDPTGPPVPVIEAPESAVAGELLELSAADSTGTITDYAWNFGDGATANGERVTHFYSQPGTRTVSLTLKDGKGREAMKTTQIYISPLSVTLPPDKSGEGVEYGGGSYVSMGNPDGMITLNYTGDGAAGDVGEQTVTIYNVDMWMNGTSTSFLTDREGNEAIIAEDCFLEQRDVVNTSSHQYYDEVEGSVLADSGRGTIQGWQEIWESSFAAMENKTTIRSSRGSRGYFHLSVGSFDEYVETKDRLITYPGPEGGGQSISVERLKKDRSFSQGDNGGKIMGDVVYVWSAVRAENMHVTVEGIDVHLPVLVLNISLNDEDMAEKGISEFSMEFWISGETSFPLKTILDVEQSSEGNSTHITTVSTATAITKGTSIIEYLPGLPTFHPWAESGGAEAEEFDTTMDIVPEYMVLNVQGQNAIPEDFTAEDAIKEARAANSELDGYLDDPGAYCIFSRYENYSHEPLWRDWWNLTFHSEGRDDMVVNVSRDSLGFEFGSSGQPAKGVPAKEDITPVLSYTGAQLIFLKHEEIYDQITENEKIDVEDGSFGTEANISLPISSPTTFLPSATGVGYGYVVEHEGGEEYKSTRAAIDAETGRYVYILFHWDDVPETL